MAALYGFTVTQVTYDFTATVTTPLSLALFNTQTSVLITATTATVQVTNQIQPVTIGGYATYNQSLNTFDNVSFASVTAGYFYGPAGSPVYFPTGIISGGFSSADFQEPTDP